MAAKDEIADDQGDTMSLVLARAEKRGDLPIFNASVGQVRRLSNDPEAHSMELAQTILKDANLSAKILRIANSPVYSRGLGKISSVSRAVVLLGFDTISNLCVTLKLIESFEHEHPAIGMNQLVARSYIAAGFARDLSIQCGSKEAEEVYICGLLHGLGEIAVAYFLPTRFNATIAAHRERGFSWVQAQQEVLGTQFSEVGQHLADTWNFSPRISNTMLPFSPTHKGPVRSREELCHALAAVGSDVVGKLFVDHGGAAGSMRELMQSLSALTGVRLERVESSLTQSFQASCELAKEYGLGGKILLPAMSDTGDDLRDRLAREFAFHASSQVGKKVEVATMDSAVASTQSAATPGVVIGVGGERRTAAGAPAALGVGEQLSVAASAAPGGANAPAVSSSGTTTTPPAATTSTRGDPLVQLSIIQEITTMVTDGESLNKLLVKIIEGLQRGVGLERILLSLVTPDRARYAGRIAMGKDTDNLRLAVSGNMTDANIFTKVLTDGGDVLVNDVNDGSWKSLISPDVIKKIGATSFILGGVRSGTKPIGFFYADNGVSKEPVTLDQRRGFAQFVAQARLAVQIRGS